MSEDAVTTRLQAVIARIGDACERFDRDGSEVHLLAVSKTRPASVLRSAYNAGQRDFGENYLQEALEKSASLNDLDITWHYIGAIQSNKTRAIALNFDWVHTVASEKVGRRLSEQRPSTMPPLKILVQVNVSNEASKAGVPPAAARDLIGSMLDYPGLEIRGLMAIPAPGSDFDQARAGFRQLRVLRDGIKDHFGDALPAFHDLSMGMTSDMEAAIAEGATWLRIGTAIFGERD